MIQLTPQMRILPAVKAVDLRKIYIPEVTQPLHADLIYVDNCP
jgi:hypothetical protein